MKGKVHPAANQFFGTIQGIARFNAQSDSLIESIAFGGLHGPTAESWDFMVGELAKKLPFLTRQAVLLTNHVMSKPVKEKMMQALIDGHNTGQTRPVYTENPAQQQTGNSAESGDDTLRIEVCGTSTDDCDEDGQ